MENAACHVSQSGGYAICWKISQFLMMNAPRLASLAPAFFRQVRLITAVESILLGLREGCVIGAVRHASIPARTSRHDKAHALVARG
jgi:hypothetical protein